MRALPLAAVAMLAPALCAGASTSTSTDSVELYEPLYQQMIVQTVSTFCMQQHPEFAEETSRVHDAWFAANEKNVGRYNDLYGKLDKGKQKEIFDAISARNHSVFEQLYASEDAGTGAQACRQGLATIEQAAPVALPPEA